MRTMKRRVVGVSLIVLAVIAVLIITRPGPVAELLPEINLPTFDREIEHDVVTGDELNPPPAIGDTLVGGIFALGPADGQLVPDYAWEDPDVTGVFLRLRWKDLQTGAETFDFSLLDHEMNQAITHGKYVTLSLGAGNDGTPDWLFTEGGVTGYDFQDGATKLQLGKCGARMTLGDPSDQAYQDQYFGALQAIADHLKTNDSWYDAVAYVKLSGANVYSHENRLPKRCQEGCICNSQVWSEAGLTPAGLQNFYREQMAVLQAAYPDKALMYALIQDGFPWMNEAGDYQLADGSSSGGELIRSIPQVEDILRLGSSTYGSRFVTQHNGLQPDHEPNPWVITLGEQGFPTAFQTSNLQVTNTPELLQRTFENFWTNSQAHYLEIYTEALRIAREEDGQLAPEGAGEANTLSEWNELLQSRAPKF